MTWYVCIMELDSDAIHPQMHKSFFAGRLLKIQQKCMFLPNKNWQRLVYAATEIQSGDFDAPSCAYKDNSILSLEGIVLSLLPVLV